MTRPQGSPGFHLARSARSRSHQSGQDQTHVNAGMPPQVIRRLAVRLLSADLVLTAIISSKSSSARSAMFLPMPRPALFPPDIDRSEGLQRLVPQLLDLPTSADVG